MSYAVGDEVIIKNIRREGKVIEVLKGGNYRVGVGPLIVNCKETDLSAPASKKKKHKPRKSILEEFSPKSGKKTRKKRPPVRTVDLHGLIVEDAMAKVEIAINQALMNDRDELRVMHGLGTGKVKAALHRYLEKADFISSFQIDPSNHGVTIIYF